MVRPRGTRIALALPVLLAFLGLGAVGEFDEPFNWVALVYFLVMAVGLLVWLLDTGLVVRDGTITVRNVRRQTYPADGTLVVFGRGRHWHYSFIRTTFPVLVLADGTVRDLELFSVGQYSMRGASATVDDIRRIALAIDAANGYPCGYQGSGQVPGRYARKDLGRPVLVGIATGEGIDGIKVRVYRDTTGRYVTLYSAPGVTSPIYAGVDDRLAGAIAAVNTQCHGIRWTSGSRLAGVFSAGLDTARRARR